jgi:hypothetical protein
VSVVASEMANGTSSTFASVRASSVLPEPVGPTRRMLLFSTATSVNSGDSAIDSLSDWPASNISRL